MIEQADRRTREWVESVLPSTTVSFAAPGHVPDGRGVSLYLMRLADAPALHNVNHRTVLQISLGYLVTAWSDEQEEAHRLLGELVFAALENPQYQVDLKPLPNETWAAFGIAPQPCFVLCVPLRLERPEPAVKYVRQPLIVQAAPVSTLSGLVLGPGDIPIAGARVELPSLQIHERTDAKGRFHLSMVPGGESATMLHIQAKGREMQVLIKGATGQHEPLVIHFDPLDKEE